MNRTIISIFLTILGIAIICSSCQSNRANGSQESPNIVLIIGDDHGYPYFGFMGADYVHTPNMDQLAASGTLFTDGYVSDNHCRPSLQTLITGLLPIDFHQRNFELMNEAISSLKINEDSIQAFKERFDRMAQGFPYFVTLPKLLAEIGYVSFQGGKWWEYSYQNGGFTHGMTKGWTQEELKEPGWFIKHMGGDGMDLARVTNQPVFDFLEKTTGHPFFIWYAPSLPHYPFDAPLKYYSLYKDQELSESAKQYYANCTWFDESVGELIKHLKEIGAFDHTLFIYVNDNGWEQEPHQEFSDDPMRSHNGGDKGKSSIYDMSFRSPIIFSWNDVIPAGIRSDALIHSSDIPATILDLVGINLPDDFFGISFKAVIEGTIEDLRDHVLGNVITTRSRDPNEVMGRHVEGYWIRQDHWFMRWHVTDNEIELFDLRNDRRNEYNRSDEFPKVVSILQKKLVNFKSEKGEDPRIAYYSNMTEK